MAWQSLYRVDNVPWWLWPLYTLVTYTIATGMYLYLRLCRLTCRIEVVGRENLPATNYILCTWHQSTWITMVALHPFPDHVWLNHAAWYMRPIHLVCHWIGVERMVLGSSGHQGREAADRLVQDLKAGKKTVMLPDGPYGPAFVAKKGVLHLSHQSGVPIVCARATAFPTYRTNEWDRKQMPIPFRTRIRVELLPGFRVTDPDAPETSARLAAELQTPN